MISHFVPAASRQDLDCAFDQLSPELRRCYYQYRYAPPLLNLVIQTLEVRCDGNSVLLLDSRNRQLSVLTALTTINQGGVNEVVINGELVYLSVAQTVLLNRLQG